MTESTERQPGTPTRREAPRKEQRPKRPRRDMRTFAKGHGKRGGRAGR